VVSRDCWNLVVERMAQVYFSLLRPPTSLIGISAGEDELLLSRYTIAPNSSECFGVLPKYYQGWV